MLQLVDAKMAMKSSGHMAGIAAKTHDDFHDLQVPMPTSLQRRREQMHCLLLANAPLFCSNAPLLCSNAPLPSNEGVLGVQDAEQPQKHSA